MSILKLGISGKNELEVPVRYGCGSYTYPQFLASPDCIMAAI